MATNYLDKLAEVMTRTDIAPNLKQVEFGVWFTLHIYGVMLRPHH